MRTEGEKRAQRDSNTSDPGNWTLSRRASFERGEGIPFRSHEELYSIEKSFNSLITKITNICYQSKCVKEYSEMQLNLFIEIIDTVGNTDGFSIIEVSHISPGNR